MRCYTALFSTAFFASTSRAFDCTTFALSSILPANASAVFAIPVAAQGSFGELADIGYPTNATNLPELCAISVEVKTSATSSYTFGVFLPSNWNARFLAVGNGGFTGGTNWLDMGNGVRYGFAVMSTDTGHIGVNANSTFALNNPEAKIDWSYRAMHGSVTMAKQIVQDFYASPPAYSYYSGCSTGGYQGLKEVQMFPEDFDGVLVGAPAWWHSHLQTWSIEVGIYNQPVTSAHHIPASLFPVVQAEVLKQCDGSDGLIDGIISDPRSCDFYPEALLCTPSTANQSACLTYPQIGTLYKIYNDWVDVNQTFVFPHLELGSESQWPLVSEDPPDPFSQGYVQNWVLSDPSWNWTDFSYETVLEAEKVGPDADNFDISAFQGRGGKLLHYHGYSDGYIPTHSSVYWYKHVLGTLAPEGIMLDDWYRFFMIPGMHHCAGTAVNAPWDIAGAGMASVFSTGTYSVPGFEDADHDAVLALMRWVENGVAPNQIIATKYQNDSDLSQGVLRQRPLCPYPTRAVYGGSGSPDNATSWTCM